MNYRYEIEFEVKAKHAKFSQKGSIKLKTLEEISDFVIRTRNKYEETLFKKYDNGVLVSTFN